MLSLMIFANLIYLHLCTNNHWNWEFITLLIIKEYVYQMLNLRTDKEWKKITKLKMFCRCCYLLKYENRSTRVHFVEVIQNNWRNIWTRLENVCSLIICSSIKTCQHYSLLKQVIENNLYPQLIITKIWSQWWHCGKIIEQRKRGAINICTDSVHLVGAK